MMFFSSSLVFVLLALVGESPCVHSFLPIARLYRESFPLREPFPFVKKYSLSFPFGQNREVPIKERLKQIVNDVVDKVLEAYKLVKTPADTVVEEVPPPAEKEPEDEPEVAEVKPVVSKQPVVAVTSRFIRPLDWHASRRVPPVIVPPFGVPTYRGLHLLSSRRVPPVIVPPFGVPTYRGLHLLSSRRVPPVIVPPFNVPTYRSLPLYTARTAPTVLAPLYRSLAHRIGAGLL